MLAHTVNAQANAVLVKIMFPAGIMQGLFFDPAADPAVNYGAIGVVEWRAAEVRNVHAWYAAFDVKPGARMYLPPDQRVKVW